MKLHKRILSAVAAFLVLTSAVDLTQIAQLSVVAAAETVDGEADGSDIAENQPVFDEENTDTPVTLETDIDENDDGEDESNENGEINEGSAEDNENEEPPVVSEVSEVPTIPAELEKIEIEFREFKYLISNTTAIVTGISRIFDGTLSPLIIPTEVEYNGTTYTVTEIGDDAFNVEFSNNIGIPEYQHIENVTIPEGVTRIGSNAFRGCSRLMSVDIPKSLTSIGEGAFADCYINHIWFGGTTEEWNKLINDNVDHGFSDDYALECYDDPVYENWSNYPYDTTINRNTIITLDDNVRLEGLIHIAGGNVTINGNGYAIARGMDMNMGIEYRDGMFLIDKGASLTIDNVTIYGGTMDRLGYIHDNFNANKEAISNNGRLEITDSAIYGNMVNGKQSNIVAAKNAVTIINSGLVVGEIDGVELNNGVRKGTFQSDDWDFNVKNGSKSVVCSHEDVLYADPEGLESDDTINGKEIYIVYDYDALSWSVIFPSPDKLTWSGIIDERTITDYTEITLEDNVTLTGTITIDGVVLIIGNGYTITRSADFKGTMFLVNDFLHTEDVTIDGNKSVVIANAPIIYNEGHLLFFNSVIKNNYNSTGDIWRSGGGIVNVDYATLDIIDSAVYGNTTNGYEQSNISSDSFSYGQTFIQNSLIVGNNNHMGIEDDLSFVLDDSVKKCTVRTNTVGTFTVTNGAQEAVCSSGDILYANPAGLKAKVMKDDGKEQIYDVEYDGRNLLFTILNQSEWDGIIGERAVINDTEITLNGDVTLTGTVNFKSKNVTINGNGHSITRGDGFKDAMFLIDEYTTITINDVIFDGNKNVESNDAIIRNRGSLTVNNCVIKNNYNAAEYDYWDIPMHDRVWGSGIVNCGYGTLVFNDSAAYGNSTSLYEQSNINSARDCTTTINGGLIVGNIDDGYIDYGVPNDIILNMLNGVVRGTIRTNASDAFTVTNGIQEVVCSCSDILYANPADLKAKVIIDDEERIYDIEYNNSNWYFTIPDLIEPDDNIEHIDWFGRIDGATIANDAEIMLHGHVIIDGPIYIESGNVTINGNGSLIRDHLFGAPFLIIGGDAVVTINDVLFDGDMFDAYGAIIVNNGVLIANNCVITNNRIFTVRTFSAGNDVTAFDAGGIANHGALTLNNCAVYGNTVNGVQSSIKTYENTTTTIHGGLIVGEVDGNGTVIFDDNMLKGVVTVNTNSDFTITNGINSAICKNGDVLYAKPANLSAHIGGNDFGAAYKNSKWVFSATCTITYVLNGGTIVGSFENPKSYLLGDAVIFPTLARSGYTFGGWYTDASFTHLAGNTVTATDSATFYAKWTQNSDTSQPGTSQPGTSQPGTNQPDTNQPGTNQPGTNQPSTNQPDTNQPSTSQPGTSTNNELINTGVIVGTNAPQGVLVSTLSDIIKYVLTNADIEAFQNNNKIDISLVITNINASTPQSDRAVIEEFIKTLNDYRLGYLLDLTLYKTVGADIYTVKETSGELTISINVPETLKASERTFGIISVHDGVATFLQDNDNNADTITFKTDKFSTYAIVYKDRQSGTDKDPTNPDTGNRTSPVIAIAPVASSLTLAATAKRKKKEEE